MKQHRSLSMAVALLAVLLAGAAAGGSVDDQTLLGSPTVAGTFEPGTTIGLEIVGDGSGDLFVNGIAMLHGDVVVREETFDPKLGSELWIGKVRLADAAGSPLAPGDYTIVVRTESGSFLVTLAIVPDLASAAPAPARSTPTSGLFIRSFRLLAEEDTESKIVVRLGDDVMIVLEGNPTTGFSWADVTENPFPVLEATPGTDYVPDAASAGLLGGGGWFVFRYRAFAVGDQALRLDYARPWETGEPEASARFAIRVVEAQ